MKEEFENIRSSLESRGEYTTPEIVRAYKNRNDMNCFFTYAGCRISELMAAGRNGTAANYRSAVNAFEHYLGNSDLSMDDLTQKTIEAFIDYQGSQGNSPNTAAFYVKQLRAIYNKAYDEGYVRPAHNPFHRIKLKGCKTPKRAIGKKEINRIAGVDLQGKHRHLELSRDLFMFSLYTRGMVFVDMCYLKKENIRSNMLVYRRRKTGQWLQIRIEAPLKELLRKYCDANSPYLLPRLRSISFRPDINLKSALTGITATRSKYTRHSQHLSEVEIDMCLKEYFTKHDVLIRYDFQNLCGMARTTANGHLKRLQEEGKLMNVGYLLYQDIMACRGKRR